MKLIYPMSVQGLKQFFVIMTCFRTYDSVLPALIKTPVILYHQDLKKGKTCAVKHTPIQLRTVFLSSANLNKMKAYITSDVIFTSH